MKHSFLTLTILLFFPLIVSAQKAPVAVKAMHETNTPVGRALSAVLKKELAKIPELTIVSPGSAFALELEVQSMAFGNKPMSLYSVTFYVNWGKNPYFIREYLVSDLGYVGPAKINMIAKQLRQKTLKIVSTYKNVVMRMLKYEKNM